MSLQICAPVSVIRNEKPNNSNNTCPYKTAKVRHLPQQIQSLSAQPPLPNVKHALTARRQAIGGTGTCTPLDCGLVGYSLPRLPPARGRGSAQAGSQSGR